MARLKKFTEESKRKRNRIFSEELKQGVVKDLEHNIASIPEIIRRYDVSRTSVYNWVYKYSAYAKRGERVVVEKKSEARKTEELKKQIKELERIIGQKQIQIDIKDKMIELAEKKYKIDIKKKFGGKH